MAFCSKSYVSLIDAVSYKVDSPLLDTKRAFEQ